MEPLSNLFLRSWAIQDGNRRAFDSSTNFNLPSGAKRQPDAAWVPKTTLQQEGPEALHPKEKTAYVYRSGSAVEEIQSAARIASTVLDGFVIDCDAIFEDL